MRTLCYSVRLESFVMISPKAYKARAFDGSEDIIPASQYFGEDLDVIKSEAHWITSWILEKKSLQYSTKKQAWFDESRRMLPNYEYDHHIPERKEPITIAPDENLIR